MEPTTNPTTDLAPAAALALAIPLAPSLPKSPVYDWRWGMAYLGKRTPTAMKALGRALIGVSVYVGGSEFTKGNVHLATYVMIAGAVGWFLTGMFTDEPLPTGMGMSDSAPASAPVAEPNNPMA